jgi:glycosyltransferase involved in cell wall biosynthesis
MAKIGIVLATYNGEKYLSQMLDSLVAQTRKADFIIAVDDGSKDNTPAILKSYQDRLPIKLTFLEKNSGHRAAFSKALELAQPQLCDNDLIALADQDDIWLPQKIETLEKEIESLKSKGELSSEELEFYCESSIKRMVKVVKKLTRTKKSDWHKLEREFADARLISDATTKETHQRQLSNISNKKIS